MKWYEDEPFRAFWEKGYRNHNTSCMGGPSFEVAEIMPALPKAASVLDLGCGEGRNALFLASCGCSVTCVDRSESAISKLKHIAKRAGVRIECLVDDIAQFPITREYDLVMAHGVLYYLEREIWKRLLNTVKTQTKEGGFNIFTLFVYSECYPCVDEIQAAGYKHSFKPCELQKFYADWHELRFDRYIKWDSHPGIPEHYHPIEKLVAQKSIQTVRKEPLEVGVDMSEELFRCLDMGLTQEQLIARLGRAHTVLSMDMAGLQYSYNQSEAVRFGNRLELWYYGHFVLYVANDLLVGRAKLITEPTRLCL